MKITEILSTNKKTIREVFNEEYNFEYKLKKINDKFYIYKKNRRAYEKGVENLSQLKTLVKNFLEENKWFLKFSKENREKIIRRFVRNLKNE
jgi:hypothetical protein